MQTYTDLAMESAEILETDRRVRYIDDNITLTSIDKGAGNRYYTYEVKANLIDNSDARVKLSENISEAISILANKCRLNRMKIMVIGLGNRGMTADALGPKVVDKIKVVRSYNGALCAFTPSVTGLTGLETYDIVKGISDRIEPDIIIAVDTLASRRVNRISSAYQISDCGIRPGSGVGNSRMAISYDTLNIPVIAIGVPLVVYAKTLASDVLSEYLDNNKYDLSSRAVEIIRKSLDYKPSDLVVTPKEIDVIVETASQVISAAINIAFYGKTKALKKM